MNALTHIDDTALVFEGGGMRGAYTAGVVTTLLDEGIDFPHVSGISAGSSHVANYVSRDSARAHDTFTVVAENPDFGGFSHWVAGRGLFNVEHIYRDIARPDGDSPFNLESFHANEAQVRIGAFNATRAEPVWFTKDDMPTVDDVGRCVRASSTLPLLMPPVIIDDEVYVDGALGYNGGIPLDAPMCDGYRKFFVVLTRPRSYVKGAARPGVKAALRAAFPELPSIAEAVARRTDRYNAARRRVFDLEARGQAYVFTPDAIDVSKSEMRVDRLEAAYEAGRAQAQRELPRWKSFLRM